MDNTRNLTSNDVPKEAIDSVETMTHELVDALIRDYVTGLKRTGKTLDASSIEKLKEYVSDNAKISMKIGIGVNEKIIKELDITVQSVNQSGFNEFEE